MNFVINAVFEVSLYGGAVRPYSYRGVVLSAAQRDLKLAPRGVFLGVAFGMLPIVHQLLGSVLVVGGAILTPTPLPIGLIMLTIGLALLAPYMPPVQRLVRAVRRKWPHIDGSLLRNRDRFPPIIRSTIDKTHPKAPAE